MRLILILISAWPSEQIYNNKKKLNENEWKFQPRQRSCELYKRNWLTFYLQLHIQEFVVWKSIKPQTLPLFCSQHLKKLKQRKLIISRKNSSLFKFAYQQSIFLHDWNGSWQRALFFNNHMLFIPRVVVAGQLKSSEKFSPLLTSDMLNSSWHILHVTAIFCWCSEFIASHHRCWPSCISIIILTLSRLDETIP